MNLLKLVLSFFVSLVIVFFSFSFVKFDYNVFDWSQDARFFFLTISILLIPFVYISIDEFKKPTK